MKINSLKKQKHGYLIHTWSDKAFKGIVVIRTLPLNFNITLSVPVKSLFCEVTFIEVLGLPFLSSLRFFIFDGRGPGYIWWEGSGVYLMGGVPGIFDGRGPGYIWWEGFRVYLLGGVRGIKGVNLIWSDPQSHAYSQRYPLAHNRINSKKDIVVFRLNFLFLLHRPAIENYNNNSN